MNLFSWIFGDKTAYLATDLKRMLSNVWEMQGAETQEEKEDIAIEFMTNGILEARTPKQYRQFAKVFNIVVPEVISNKELARMFMDRVYGRAAEQRLLSVAEAKQMYAEFLNKLNNK